MDYQFRSGFQGRIDAQVAGAELERINKQHGGLIPSVVVDEARPKKAPLHPQFEWRDETAAEKYREWQARSLIRSVVILKGEEQRPVYVHVRPQVLDDGAKTQSSYQPIALVVKQPDMFRVALEELRDHLLAAQKAVDDLQAAAGASKARRKVAGDIRSSLERAFLDISNIM